ncbi:hypothetical protein BDY19DRAFT_152916 [Irpex rosettiformis]|uniref:Uncharacterized protein n=1 Tax=Irpex rosettiformis TaxID=378272 RepID=A0ACB8U3Q5_9APHY|nr:hypothetical protein BDY19DRAFT_152916 [Irpex rosettiformis]
MPLDFIIWVFGFRLSRCHTLVSAFPACSLIHATSPTSYQYLYPAHIPSPTPLFHPTTCPPSHTKFSSFSLTPHHISSSAFHSSHSTSYHSSTPPSTASISHTLHKTGSYLSMSPYLHAHTHTPQVL